MAGEPSGLTSPATKTGSVFIEWKGIAALTLTGSEAAQFLEEVEGSPDADQEMLMARKVGSLKRGNEHTLHRSKRRC